MRKYLDTDATRTLVATLVTSQLDYCNGLLIGLSKATVKKLQRVQNTAARIIARQGKYDHISPVLRDLHWLPVDQRIEFKVLVLAFKALHGLAPHYLQELLQPYNPKRELRSSHRGMLAEPTYRREGLEAGPSPQLHQDYGTVCLSTLGIRILFYILNEILKHFYLEAFTYFY